MSYWHSSYQSPHSDSKFISSSKKRSHHGQDAKPVVLLTSAQGLFSTRIIESLCKSGCEVVAVSPTGRARVKHDKFEVVKGRWNSKKLMDRVLGTVDVIIHNAFLEGVSPSEKYIQDTTLLARKCAEMDVSRFVMISHTDVIGGCPDDGADETNYPEPTSRLGRLLHEAESQVQRILRGRLHYIIIRLAPLYAAGEDNLLRDMIRLTKSGLTFLLPISGRWNRGMVLHVDDAVQAVTQTVEDVLDKGLDQIYIVCPRHPAATYKDMFDAVSLGFSRQQTVFGFLFPAFLCRLLALILLPIVWLALGSPAKIFRLISWCCDEHWFYCHKAHGLLGFEPEHKTKAGLANEAALVNSNEISPVTTLILLALVFAPFLTITLCVQNKHLFV